MLPLLKRILKVPRSDVLVITPTNLSDVAALNQKHSYPPCVSHGLIYIHLVYSLPSSVGEHLIPFLCLQNKRHCRLIQATKKLLQVVENYRC